MKEGGRGAWGTGCGLVQRFRDKSYAVPAEGKGRARSRSVPRFPHREGGRVWHGSVAGSRWDAPALSSEGGLADSGCCTRACCQRPGHRGRAAGTRAAGPVSAVGPSSGASQRRLRACGPWGGRKEDGGPGCPGRAGLSCRAIPQRAVQDHLSAARSLPRREQDSADGHPACIPFCSEHSSQAFFPGSCPEFKAAAPRGGSGGPAPLGTLSR